ncbi:MAG: efflux RND transporter permease subunit [Verrucomicrobiota bacterium]
MSLSAPFIRRPVMTMMCVMTAVVFGLLSYVSLPISDLPDVSSPVITCNVSWPGASPQTMAANVATPLEQQFMTIEGLDMITSQSMQGQTNLTLQFDLNKNIDAAATDVQTAITKATPNLPPDLPSPPTYTKTNPNDKPIIYLSMISDTMTLGDLYDYAQDNVSQKISIMSGVSQVQVYGAMRAFRIEVDPSVLAARGMTVNDFVNLAKKGTTFQGAGQFDGDETTFLLQPQGQLETVEDYENLILKEVNGRPLRLGDIAKVYESVDDTRMQFNYWKRGENPQAAAVVVAVTKSDGANTVKVAQDIKDSIPVFQAQLPGSIKLLLAYDRSVSIVDSVEDVETTLMIAFVLVVLVIYIFLGRATDTIIPAVALPLSLLLVFIPMYLLGFSLDNLSLMALTLAIGFLVDDAIVFLENTVRRMEGGEDAMTAAINGASEISFTILSMTLSLCAVFIPLACMAGYVGRLFVEFGITIIIAIICSGLVSLTVTPLMCSRMLGNRVGTAPTFVERVVGGYIDWFIQAYGRSLHFYLRHRWISAAAWVVAMALTIYFYIIVPKSFLPVGDSGFVQGIFISNQSTSPDQMTAYQQEIQEVLVQGKHVNQVMTLTSYSMAVPNNQGLIMYFLDDGPRPAIGPINKVMQLNLLEDIPGILPLTRPVPVLEVSSGATSTNQGQYAYSLNGTDPDEVYATGQKMLEEMRKMPEMATVSSDMMLDAAQLEITIKREQASTYGVSANEIETTLRNAYAQNYIYKIKEPTNQYEVIVETGDDFRRYPDNLGLLWVNSSNGGIVPMSAVAEWKETTGPLTVNHIDQFTSVTIYFDLKPGAALSAVTKSIDEIAARVKPSTVQGALQGETNLFQQMVDSLSVLLIFAVFVMYVILGVLYESYLHPITVLSALPVAVVGGIGTLLVCLWTDLDKLLGFESSLSLYAFIGLFMLMGIVKKNGIMMIDFALQQMDKGKSPYDAVHEASVERFRPIMMTTLAAFMGAVPLAMGWGADGSSRQPLGFVIVGGLVVSQVITLYVTPVLFLYFEDLQEKVLDKWNFTRRSKLGPADDNAPANAGKGAAIASN